MGQEIERKFLVTSDRYRQEGKAERYLQGYLSLDAGRIVRLRMAGKRGVITIKGMAEGISRSEFEYTIPGADAQEMLQTLCHRPLIEKLRYKVRYKEHTWEVDEFLGINEGLVVAEIELRDPDEAFEKPDWVGMEVTSDRRYTNSNLVLNPYSQWPDRS